MDLSACYLHTLGEREKGLLEQLRAGVPEIVKRVKEESPEAFALPKLTIWNIDIEGNTEARDIILLKYLRAEELNLEKAKDRVAMTLLFRADVRVDELVESDLPDYFLGHDFMSGYDVGGRPVLISNFGTMDIPKVFGDTEAFVRYRAKIMEEHIALLKFTKGAPEDLCAVHDYSGVPLNPGQEVKACVNAVSRVFGEHYPEFKGKTLFVNFPNVFASLWKAFSIAIPERTRNKMDVLPKNDAAALFKHIPPEAVPVALDGMYRKDGERGRLPQETACFAVAIGKGCVEEVRLAEVSEKRTVAFELRVCNAQEIAWEVVFTPLGGEPLPVAQNEGEKYLTADAGIVDGEYETPGAGVLAVRFKNEAAWWKSRFCVCRAGVF